MNKEMLNEKINNRLCEEFQSVWIVDAETLEMQLFVGNEKESIQDSLGVVQAFNSYEMARVWYVKNCVQEQDKVRLLEQSDIKYIYPKIKDGQPYYVEYSRCGNGTVNYNQLWYAKLEEDEMKHFIIGFRDIDVRKKAERDDLTGLYTRQFFFQKAEQLLKDNPDVEYDLMISDIVEFKAINENYGVKVGDEILRWTGSYLAPAISDDVLVGRYGGDQFVVMASHERMSQINGNENVSGFQKAKKENGLPATTVKFGVYENVPHDRSIISICDKAHIALNSIKHKYDKTLTYYDEKLKQELEVSRRIENSMYEALESEQFKVYYQPKHDAETGKLVGAEALIRWEHPEYGFMSPGQFIPMFEKNGFIVEADAYVWKRTCRNLKKWHEKGIKTVPISVNASKLTFAQQDLLVNMHNDAQQYEVTPDQLHIEITETLMTEDLDALVKKLAAIRAVGYKVELDDFGAGYSSINMLSTLPLDIVKLDMSFMKQFGDEKRTKVLGACIKLAKELGYKTVSEGVELKEQRDMLSILGVDVIQGYYYSKPIREEEFEQYMLENSIC